MAARRSALPLGGKARSANGAGHPFIGPAGKLLDRAPDEADIERTQVFVANVVKHFSWEPRRKRRIHKKPAVREIAA